MSAPAATGQVYRWLGADVLVDEVAADGSGARITIREGDRRPRQKWAQLPFPPEAVLVSSPAASPGRERTHWEQCWTVHDDCALAKARDQLATLLADRRSASPSEVADRLLQIREGIAGHASRECPALAHSVECIYAVRAREVLRGEWPPASGADAVQAAAAEIAGLP